MKSVWQPIETAPRDGTEFLMWVHWPEGASYVLIASAPVPWPKRYGWWRTGTMNVPIAETHAPLSGDGWRATHWMPLPEPPSFGAADGAGCAAAAHGIAGAGGGVSAMSWTRNRSIDEAPKDGTVIYAYDGEWWRPVKWDNARERWIFQGYLAVQASVWQPIDHEYERLLVEIAKGYAPA